MSWDIGVGVQGGITSIKQVQPGLLLCILYTPAALTSKNGATADQPQHKAECPWCRVVQSADGHLGRSER